MIEPAIPDLARQAGAPVARIHGEPLLEMPHDLYIPPEALEVFLDAFEGPLDLLLYLIRKENLDILDIPMAPLTRQYLEYVENKTGSGTLKFAAPVPASGGYQGGTNITKGTLEFVAGAFFLYDTFDTTKANIKFTGTLPTDNPTLKWSTGNTTANWIIPSDGDVSDRLRIADGVNATLDTNGNDVTFSAATILDGNTSTGSLTKAGLGTLTLATSQRSDATPGPAGYSGGTNIFDGTLEFVSGALPVSGLVNL